MTIKRRTPDLLRIFPSLFSDILNKVVKYRAIVSNIFTPEQIDTLSAEIDRQIQELGKASPSDIKQGATKEPDGLPVKQSQAIAEITQENPKTFLQTFLAAAKSDLCEEGGVLYTQWKKWADLNNKDVIERFTAILVALGFTGNSLEILLVSVAVIVIHLGAKAFCEYYSQ